MPTWREEAAQIIADAARGLPPNASLSDRMAVIDAACPSSWRMMSWPQKAWQAARRDYLVRYGYRPRTKKQKQREMAVFSDLPLFDHAPPAAMKDVLDAQRAHDARRRG